MGDFRQTEGDEPFISSNSHDMFLGCKDGDLYNVCKPVLDQFPLINGAELPE